MPVPAHRPTTIALLVAPQPLAVNQPPAIQWRIATDFTIVTRHWDDECLVFHTGSGNTHLLNTVAAAMLEQLRAGPATLERLCELLADSLGYHLDEEFQAYLRQTSAELHRLELIEAVPERA